MNLYAFGYIPSTSSQAPSLPTTPDNTPTPILQAHTIKILWSSWCDILIAYETAPEDPWRLEYRGASLITTQKLQIEHSPNIRNILVNEDLGSIDLIGSDLHHGLQGYILHSPTNQIVLFSTNTEIQSGAPASRTYPIHKDWKCTAIRIDSRIEVLASITSTTTNESYILRFKSLADLADHLSKPALHPPSSPPTQIASFTPVKWHSTCTTSIALHPNGQIYTATSDSRYQKCLARANTDTSTFEGVPYFSETRVKKIAAGGYMVAAISSDDELFIWGQANPGCQVGLVVLIAESDEGEEGAGMCEAKGTRVSVSSGYQDETIKSLEVFIDGEEARPYDVAIGNGHVLVAAEVQRADGTKRRAVLSAGANDRGQTGISSRSAFVEDFEEIVTFRGMKIEEIVASGWTTFVVTR